MQILMSNYWLGLKEIPFSFYTWLRETISLSLFFTSSLFITFKYFDAPFYSPLQTEDWRMPPVETYSAAPAAWRVIKDTK